MSERSRVQVHTRLTPPGDTGAAKAERAPRVRWASVPRARWVERLALRRAPGDRLLRDTAVACALLLCVMALRNADIGWARAAARSVERAVTMKIDLDESLGRLHFVREWVPEAALVFLNAGADRLRAPVEGEIAHAFDADQPWRIYSCEGGAQVRAALDGEVKAVERGSGAEYIVIMTHDNGMESVYAYMAEVCVQPGDSLYSGDAVGFAAGGDSARVYFALRLDGLAVDPTEYM